MTPFDSHDDNSSTPSSSISRRDLLTRTARGAGVVVAASAITPASALASVVETPLAAKSVVVAGKDFTEDQLVAHMYTLLLKQAGFQVTEKFGLTTQIAMGAFQKGSIDIFPEYTGTGVEVVLKEMNVPHSADGYYKAAKDGYEKKYHLTWLQYAPMNDTQGLAMTQDGARKFGIKTISDMVKKTSQLRFIVNSEFLTRPDGLPGLERVYGKFKFKSIKQISSSGAVRYAALKRGEGDVVVAFTTDGPIAAYKLVVLQDDKHYAPPDNLAPVVRDSVLQRYPEIKGILNKLAPKLTSSVIQKLNYEVDGPDKQDIDTVARTFLQQQSLLKK